jgi:hypothetical protein
MSQHEIAAECASNWMTSHWIAALANGNRYDLLCLTEGISGLFNGNVWEKHSKWLVTDDQLYVTDLYNCAGCLDSTL